MMIKVNEVSTKIAGRQILERVSFEVEAGETLALVGSNGAGKTSLLRCVLGLVRYSGSIQINGFSLEKEPVHAKALIGYMPQVPAFCEETVKESLLFLARLRRVDPSEIWPLLDRVGLIKDAARPVAVLSTGMKQRLSLAASLIGRPPVLILDEPTASLDLQGQVEIVRFLQELQSQGQTILISSHRAEEVRALAQTIVVMDEGKVVSSGPLEEVASMIWDEPAVNLEEPKIRRVK
jgi:ABC-type multidrug transport system ATPase subunit